MLRDNLALENREGWGNQVSGSERWGSPRPSEWCRKVGEPPILTRSESHFGCDFQKLSGNQKRASSVEVNRKQVQPVSLHTR
jgi:hypothetical protein